MDVRRLAAVDMYGSAGAPWRRWVILAEFVLGVAGPLVIAILLLGADLGAPSVAVTVWLIGLSANYVPLAWLALTLSRPGALDAEVAGVDIPAELRHYTAAQFWVFVPFLLAVLAFRQARRH
jgi:hypothetical protein